MNKTYTLTWVHEPYFGSVISRCVMRKGASLWNPYISDDVIIQFCNRLLYNYESLRLTSCGKLVARSATYQGV